MRLVSAALKVVPDIERIGDHVADIVELYLRMGNMNPEGKQEHLLLEMMEEAKEMIHNSVEAFVEGDEANARKVVEHDDVVDDLFNEVKTGMMQAIREQNLDADRVVDYLMMAKYLEKVGDHAVNIAEWAIFRMTGDMGGARLY
jgi:phosphate transport system protein